MAREIVVLILSLTFFTGCIMPAFAEQKKATTKKATTTISKEKPLWEIVGDSLKDFKIREQDKIKGVDKVSIFQETSDGIKNYSDSARNQSLRGKK